MRHVQLFISAVTKEFGSYREALRRQLQRPNVTVHVQEDFIPTGTETLDMLDLYIGQCDAVIHLAGDMTGALARPASFEVIRTRYPDFAARLPELKVALETGDPPLSYTQWEAYLAVYHRKRLIIAEPAPAARRDAGHVIDAAQQEAQRRHRELLRAHERYGFDFTDEPTLSVKVLRSPVLELLSEADVVPAKPVALPYASLGTLFKGREQFVTDLRASLKRASDGRATAIVTAVHGLGGIGKTRLAVEYAWQHRDYTALLFVAADTPADLRRNLAALVGPLVLNLPEQDRSEEQVRIAGVLRWMQQNPGWFLIIDNVDSEDAAEAVETLVANLHGGEVLITSRLAKWGKFVDRLELDVLTEDAAVAFLLERTAKDRRRAADDARQARVLARELGQLALMLEQAGAYIEEHRQNFAQYLGEWHANRERVSAWFDERVMKYPRSVAVTWQTSVDQLGEPARRLLRRLAWLSPEPVPESLLDVAAAGETDQRATLAELARYSLVTRARDASTFTIHRLVADVTRRTLAGEARRTALTWALMWINDAFVGNEDDLRERAALDLLAPHVLAVAEHGHAADVPQPTARLSSGLADLLTSRVPLAEVEPLYKRARAIFGRLAAADPDNADLQRDLGVSHNKVGNVLVAQGDRTAALASFRDGLAIAERLAKADPDNAGWQRDLGVSYNKVGDVLVAQGELAAALKAYRDSLAIAERLAQADPGNAGWQRDLSVYYDRVGDVLAAQGNLSDALKAYRDSLANFERLAQADPGNAGWQRDLSVSTNKVGDVLVAQGNLPDALNAYRDSLAIAERLAQADPGNAGWQRDLSVYYDRVGDVLAAQGNLSDALKAYRDSLANFERLAQADPGNAGWQRDLSVSTNKVGDVLVAQGNLPDALNAYRDSLAIAERLAQADPGNAGWQRDLSVSYSKVGNVLVAQGELAAALTAYRDSLAIRERLAQADPGNAGWQLDLAIAYDNVGGVFRAQGDLSAALEQHRKANEIFRRLAKADPGNAGWQRDLSVSYNKFGDVLVAQGELAAALKAYRDSLAIRERLAQADPGNAGWQRDVAVSHAKLASVYLKLGNGADALAALRTGRAIMAALVALSPTNAEWKNDLAWFGEIARLAGQAQEQVKN